MITKPSLSQFIKPFTKLLSPTIFLLTALIFPADTSYAQSFTRIDTGVIATDGGYSQGSSWGDFDNDGDLDLFVTNFEENNLYRNDQDSGLCQNHQRAP